MSIYGALSSYVLAYPGMSDLIGDRMEPDEVPDFEQAAMPMLVYRRISNEVLYGMKGSHGWRKPRFQFEVWADDRGDADEAGELLIEAMEEASGQRIGTGAESVRLGSVQLRGDFDALARGARKFVRILDFSIQHEE